MELEKEFAYNIHKYCDENIGEKVSFTIFPFLCSQQNQDISPRDLASKTGMIVHDLVGKGILVEVPKEFESVYAMYEILPHKNISEDGRKLNYTKICMWKKIADKDDEKRRKGDDCITLGKDKICYKCDGTHERAQKLECNEHKILKE